MEAEAGQIGASTWGEDSVRLGHRLCPPETRTHCNDCSYTIVAISSAGHDSSELPPSRRALFLLPSPHACSSGESGYALSACRPPTVRAAAAASHSQRAHIWVDIKLNRIILEISQTLTFSRTRPTACSPAGCEQFQVRWSFC